MNSLYGNYRTRKFSDIYGDFNTFNTDYQFYVNNGLNTNFQAENTIQTLYMLLCSRYMNSNIASSDENQFKLKLFSIIYQYGPTWEKRLKIQSDLRALTNDDLQSGSTAIYNHSFNPSTTPSTQTKDELPTVDDQNVTKHKKSKMDAYANLMALLEKDVTEEFLNKFKKLFLTVVEPELPLWYITEV